MRRRDLLGALAGLVAVRPVTGRAQQSPRLPTIGFLGQSTPSVERQRLAAFLKRLSELGWIEGRTVVIEYAWGEGNSERFAKFATDFVRLRVDVIVTSGTANVIAAMQATSVIPIVFAVAGDPVANKLVASLAKPGGNVTGLSTVATDLAGKRLELLREAIPSLRRLAAIGNIGNSLSALELSEVQAAAARLGLETDILTIRQAEDIPSAFEALKGGAGALYIVADPLVNTHRDQIQTLAMGARLPTIYNAREHVEAGGLMSYGPNFTDLYRRAAEYVDRILRGAKPANLPVEQPAKFDFVVNLRTAKALGLALLPSMLARADEVIE
ncbi:putative ABC transport system substrate-binding protein [Bradyrhizobium sp. USDA 372]